MVRPIARAAFAFFLAPSLQVCLAQFDVAPDVGARLAVDAIDMPSSSECNPETADATRFSDDFAVFPASRSWDVSVGDLEQEVFLAGMEHSDTDPSKAWELRVG